MTKSIFATENKAGATFKMPGKDGAVITLSAAGKRMFLKVPAKNRASVLARAEEIRIEQGHPLVAGATCNRVWDQHLAQALGAENTPEAIAALRKELDLPRPARV